MVTMMVTMMMAAPVMTAAMVTVPHVMAASVMPLILSGGGKRACYDEGCSKS